MALTKEGTALGPLRWRVGDEVECWWRNSEAPGCWLRGTVLSHWWRAEQWPKGQYAPYQVRLKNGTLIFAPRDDDSCIRESAPDLDLDPDRPEEPPEEPAMMRSQGPPPPQEEGMPWRQVKTKEGKTYYYHPVTKETSWDDPDKKPRRTQQHAAVRHELPGPQPAAATLPERVRQAAEEGNKEVVNEYLSQNPDSFDAADSQGRTLLMTASFGNRGSEEIVQTMLGRRASPDQSDCDGSTALMYACVKGRDQVAMMLLQAGSPPTPTLALALALHPRLSLALALALHLALHPRPPPSPSPTTLTLTLARRRCGCRRAPPPASRTRRAAPRCTWRPCSACCPAQSAVPSAPQPKLRLPRSSPPPPPEGWQAGLWVWRSALWRIGRAARCPSPPRPRPQAADAAAFRHSGHPPLVQRLLCAGGDAEQVHAGVAMDALGIAEAAAHAEILGLLRRPAAERSQPLQLSQEVGLHGLRWMASDKAMALAQKLGPLVLKMAGHARSVTLAQAARQAPRVLPELLRQAAEVPGVMLWVNQGGSVDACDEDGVTLLMRQVRAGTGLQPGVHSVARGRCDRSSGGRAI